jgi:polyisoprenoid-binding protein YceI
MVRNASDYLQAGRVFRHLIPTKGTEPMKAFVKRNIRWILIPVLGVIVVGAAGFYWMLSGTSAAPLALRASTSLSAAASGSNLSGHWTVVAGPVDQPTTAGYRVVEKVAGGLASDTATGRTGDVTGSVTVVGKQVTVANFTVNMATLKSDKSLRDTVLKTNAIETNKYPKAEFTLANPVVLPNIISGKIYAAKARGTLRLHGFSKVVNVTLQYQETKTGIVLLVDMPITMANYSIKAPSIAGVVAVENHGSFELRANLVK